MTDGNFHYYFVFNCSLRKASKCSPCRSRLLSSVRLCYSPKSRRCKYRRNSLQHSTVCVLLYLCSYSLICLSIVLMQAYVSSDFQGRINVSREHRPIVNAVLKTYFISYHKRLLCRIIIFLQ